jgi:hypothetical protein
VQPHPLQATHPQRREPPFVLQPAELTLDRAASFIERAEARGAARDERVQPRRGQPN